MTITKEYDEFISTKRIENKNYGVSVKYV